ncbi:hypothetical protein Tco_0228742 [Tanacetum coccineum]
MVTSSDVEDIVSKLSSDKAKSSKRKRGPFLLDCSLRLYNWRNVFADDGSSAAALPAVMEMNCNAVGYLRCLPDAFEFEL